MNLDNCGDGILTVAAYLDELRPSAATGTGAGTPPPTPRAGRMAPTAAARLARARLTADLRGTTGAGELPGYGACRGRCVRPARPAQEAARDRKRDVRSDPGYRRSRLGCGDGHGGPCAPRSALEVPRGPQRPGGPARSASTSRSAGLHAAGQDRRRGHSPGRAAAAWAARRGPGRPRWRSRWPATSRPAARRTSSTSASSTRSSTSSTASSRSNRRWRTSRRRRARSDPGRPQGDPRLVDVRGRRGRSSRTTPVCDPAWTGSPLRPEPLPHARLADRQHHRQPAPARPQHNELSDDRQLMLVVDYLQKVPMIPEPATEAEKVTFSVNGLKDIALSEEVPMIAIVAADKEGLKAPRLRNHHLRGSSAINYEADIILILNEKYNIVAKVNIEFNPYQAQRFRDWVDGLRGEEPRRPGQRGPRVREALRVLLLRPQRASGAGEAHRGAPLQRRRRAADAARSRRRACRRAGWRIVRS